MAFTGMAGRLWSVPRTCRDQTELIGCSMNETHSIFCVVRRCGRRPDTDYVSSKACFFYVPLHTTVILQFRNVLAMKRAEKLVTECEKYKLFRSILAACGKNMHTC